MNSLAQCLTERLPGGMVYPDAVQLCLRLYCTAGGVPDALRRQLTRLGLADTFAELAKTGWIRECDDAATKSDHWIEVIASIFRKGADVVEQARGEKLARKVGFG